MGGNLGSVLSARVVGKQRRLRVSSSKAGLKRVCQVNSAGHAKNNHKQRDLLDLITALLQSQRSAHSKDSLSVVDVMVLIWNCPPDMYGH